MDERVRETGRGRRYILIAGGTLVAALLVLGGIAALMRKSGGTSAAGPDRPASPGRSTAAGAEPSVDPTPRPTPSRSDASSPTTPAGSLSPSVSGQAPKGSTGTSAPRLAAAQRSSFRVTAIKVYLTSTSYRVAMSTKGGPPWTPFTLTVTAGPGLVASGATGRPVVISGARPASYGGPITSHSNCQDWTITATITPGPAAPGGLTDTGILQQAC